MTDTTDIARRVSMTANGDTYEIWLDANRYHYRTDGFAVLMLEGMNHSYPRRVQSAAIKAALKAIVELHGKLEAERQRADEVERCGRIEYTRRLEKRVLAAEAELAALKGEQVPVAWTSQRSLETKNKIVAFTDDMSALDYGVANGWTDIVELFTAPQKPVVLLPPAYEKSADFMEYHQGWNACRNYMLAESKEVGGIVKDGE